MARPGFVLEVDDRTPGLLVTDGPRLRLERFPLGTEVVYPPESLPAVDDLVADVDRALAEPLEAEPLAARLRPGMRLTIAFDDVTATPPLATPDPRGRIIERVLIQAAAAGVDDVALICANGLDRRNTEAELRQLLGERVFRSFRGGLSSGAGGLTNHDAENPELLTEVAGAETGLPPVAVNSRVAESDLLVMVRLVGAPDDGGAAAIHRGLGSVAGIAAERGLAAVTDPDRRARARAAEAITAAIPVFQIEAVLDNNYYPEPVSFLGGREWEWRFRDQAKLVGLRRAIAAAPTRTARVLDRRLDPGFGVSQVNAGAPQAVARASRQQILQQQQVEVSGQADVLVLGVPSSTPPSVGSVTNPVLAAWHALGSAFGMTTAGPLVREGGAVVVYHPLARDFSPLHHPSTIDFFADVLPETTDPQQLADKYEPAYAADPWYAQLYRTSQAYHGLQPLHLWYQLAAAVEHCGDIVFVGADRSSAARMGFRAASTLPDALEIASGSVGRSPKIRYLHSPPATVGALK